MRGLVMKDILVMKKNLKMYILFLAFYLAMAFVGVFGVSVAVAMTQVILMILPISSFNYDEFYHWDRFAAILPVGRRVVVGGRYLFLLLLTFGALAYNMVVTVLVSMVRSTDLMECSITVLVSVSIGLFIAAVMLPLCYRLGAERARPFLFVIVLLPTLLGVLAYQSGALDWIDLKQLASVSEMTVLLFVTGFFVAMLAALGVSYLVSCRILEKKEL